MNEDHRFLIKLFAAEAIAGSLSIILGAMLVLTLHGNF
jgi:hypothetical protein